MRLQNLILCLIIICVSLCPQCTYSLSAGVPEGSAIGTRIDTAPGTGWSSPGVDSSGQTVDIPLDIASPSGRSAGGPAAKNDIQAPEVSVPMANGSASASSGGKPR
ncbi:uncharacterized protein LOC129584414 [Paramacrobiotus metropolitanus]|uniref:uncharacterized protein LOC129584414 n=1 Tax=Paramacrobiotus metropolitanus TaxID=2943436 RepID=UPI002445B08F|nr:uncharacterized protein LOC129584414 [Paramacrobiotus metropolitanus]